MDKLDYLNIALSGLLGAIIGGIATYFAASKQYRVEHQTRQRSALLAIMLEMCRNQSTLTLDLDRVLPLWLARNNLRPEFLASRLRHLTTPLAEYRTRVYDSFFKELISSRYGPEINNYYHQIHNLNYLAEKYRDNLTVEDFRLYVQSLAHAIILASDLVNELNYYYRREIKRNWGRDADVSSFKEGSKQFLFLAALSKTSLKDITKYLSGTEVPSTISENLIENKNVLSKFKRDAENEISIVMEWTPTSPNGIQVPKCES